MKQAYLLILLLAFCTLVIAQPTPGNDICTGARLIVPDGTCYDGTTIGSNDQWTGTVGCQGSGGHPEVWYTFVSTGSHAQFRITASAPWTGMLS